MMEFEFPITFPYLQISSFCLSFLLILFEGVPGMKMLDVEQGQEAMQFRTRPNLEH